LEITTMAKTRVAIACQGGGSQTAFTAGALKALCEANIVDEIDVVSISGTSGGAVCAALVWYAFAKGERPIWGRLMDFWKDNTAQNWAEKTSNQIIIKLLRMINEGRVPAFQISPASPWLQTMMQFAAIGQRPEFTDFSTLLRTYIDFSEISAWGPRASRPILIIGAANVTTGKLSKFVSTNEPIHLEHILASCAVPAIFPAVQIGEYAYWDGLFSDNPPVSELIRAASVGAENIPEEIWLIKINQTACHKIPALPSDILDRRNQLEGNISLFHQISQLEALNEMLLARAFRPEYLARIDIKAPIRIPKCFATDPDRPYHIPCIEMGDDLHETFDYESKIDRSARNIDRLIAEGQCSAERFLDKRAARVKAAPSQVER
jgi:NTE family protein